MPATPFAAGEGKTSPTFSSAVATDALLSRQKTARLRLMWNFIVGEVAGSIRVMGSLDEPLDIKLRIEESEAVVLSQYKSGLGKEAGG